MMMVRRLKIVCVALVVAAIALATPCYAQSTKEIEAQKKKIEQLESQIAQRDREIAKIQKDKRSKNTRVQQMTRQISDRERLLRQTEQQMLSLQSEIKSKNHLIDSLDGVVARERELYAEMVREAYRNYRQNNYALYLLASTNFVDAARRIANIRSVAEVRKARIRLIDSLSDKVLRERAALNDKRADLEATRRKTEQHRDRLKGDVAAVQREIKKLTADERRSLREKVEAEENLDAAVAALRKMTKGNTAGASFSAKTTGLTLPVVGGTVREYKKNMAEIVGKKGSRVRSIYEGKVIDIRQNKVTGMWDIFIAHGEYITSYSNLADVKVKVKDVVVEKQTIGTIGAAINITSAQIEYRMVFGIYAPNPKQVLKASDCFKRK